MAAFSVVESAYYELWQDNKAEREMLGDAEKKLSAMKGR